MIKKRHLPFWLFTIAIFIGVILPVLIQDGMFMDGMLYTCVAKNLSNGFGTFWFPMFSETWIKGGLTSFHEYPPLIFGIQSLFFNLLGNGMYVERFYSFLTAIITAFLIHILWKSLFKQENRVSKLSWLPILLWIIVPIAHWAYQNNMQENTMGIFTLLAVYFSLKAIKSLKNNYIYIVIAGVFIFLASFSKGVPGLFPIGVVGFYWLINKNISFSKSVIYTLILILVPVVIYALLMINEQANQSLSFYVNERLLNRIDTAPTVENRFSTLFGLVSHLLPTIIFTIIMFIVFKIKKVNFKVENKYKNYSILFFAIGLSASLPLMLTMVQKDFYFAHSIPYFGVAFAMLLAPGLKQLFSKIDIQKKGFKVFKISSIVLLSLSIIISISFIGKRSRNNDILNDVYVIGNKMPDKSTVSVVPSFYDWQTRTYQMRYFNTSFDGRNNHHKYYMVKKGSKPNSEYKYKKIDLDTKVYDLYELID